jgi:hypothetical protein
MYKIVEKYWYSINYQDVKEEEEKKEEKLLVKEDYEKL